MTPDVQFIDKKSTQIYYSLNKKLLCNLNSYMLFLMQNKQNEFDFYFIFSKKKSFFLEEFKKLYK